MRSGYMYILKCSDESYYVGSTKWFDLRISQQLNGEGAKHVKKRLPAKLIYFEKFPNVTEAFNHEHQIKKWSKKKKDALVNGQLGFLSKLAKKNFNP